MANDNLLYNDMITDSVDLKVTCLEYETQKNIIVTNIRQQVVSCLEDIKNIRDSIVCVEFITGDKINYDLFYAIGIKYYNISQYLKICKTWSLQNKTDLLDSKIKYYKLL